MRLGAVLFLILSMSSVGCLLIDSSSELIALEKGVRECLNQSCEAEKWLVVILYGKSVSIHAPWPNCNNSYSLEFVSNESNPIITASLNAARNLLLACVTRDGVLHLSEFGESTAIEEVQADALGVAWSNAGDRLAVARAGDSPTEYLLDILTPELDYLSTYVLSLPAKNDGVPGWRLAISWNATDEAVAVSATVGPVGAQLISLSSGSIASYQLSNVYFLAGTTIVATEPDCTPCAVLYDIDGVALSRRRVLPGANGPFWSHPVTGVFASEEGEPLQTVNTYPWSLRTDELGPNLMGYQYHYEDTIRLLPLEESLPTLDAAGFGPEDAIAPDPDGFCP